MPDETDVEPVDPDAPPPIYHTIGSADGADDDETDAEVTARLESARSLNLCKRCGEPIPAEMGRKGRPLVYHPECRPGAAHNGMTGNGSGPTINVGQVEKPTSRKAKEKAEQLEAVEQNTKALFEHFVAPMLMMAAQSRQSQELMEDAADLNRGAGDIAKATRNLAEHEEWLRKMLAGGQASARAMAWVGFLFTVGPVMVPILVRHKVLPSELAGVAGASPQPAAA